MSSPIAKSTHELTFLNKAVNAFHQKVAHSRRIDILSTYLVACFKDIVGQREMVKCLDVGCGDLSIMKRIANGVPATSWECLDIYDLPEHLRTSPEWSCYKKFNGRELPFADNSIDILLFCDMLHHANKNIPSLLKEAHRVGTTVVVKDSFEYSLYSRAVLQLMDIIGNWGYGVPLPDRYFTIDSFKALCVETGFRITRLDIGIQIYDHLPIIRTVVRPRWQFIAVLERM